VGGEGQPTSGGKKRDNPDRNSNAGQERLTGQLEQELPGKNTPNDKKACRGTNGQEKRGQGIAKKIWRKTRAPPWLGKKKKWDLGSTRVHEKLDLLIFGSEGRSLCSDSGQKENADNRGLHYSPNWISEVNHGRIHQGGRRGEDGYKGKFHGKKVDW